MIQGYRSQSKRCRTNGLAKGLWREDLGASLVEFALLIPFLMSLMIGIIEMSNVFFIRSALNEVVRDAARRFAVGALDESGTEQLVLRKVAETIDSKGSVQVTETEDEEANKKSGNKVTNADVTVTLSVPLQELLLFRNLSGGLVTFGGAKPNLVFSATMLKY